MQDVITFTQSFSPLLTQAIGDLRHKLGDDAVAALFDIDGIGKEKTDLAKRTKTYFTSSMACAEFSADPNANVTTRSADHFSRETIKPFLFFNTLDCIIKEICNMDGHDGEDAKRVIRKLLVGEIFVNDIHKWEKPYCFAFSLDKLCQEGISFASPIFDIVPPKHSASFIALVIQMVSYISQHIAGASSFPSFFVDLDYFYRKELGDDYLSNPNKAKYNKKRIKNQFQNLIYSFNWPFRGNESPFTNLSIFDKEFLTKLFADYVYPDYSHPNLDNVDKLQRLFAEYFSEIFGTEGIFTFPVTTLAISTDEKGEVVDEDFVQWASKVNADKAIFNIYIGPPTSLSTCCRLKNGFSMNGNNKKGGQSLGYTNSFGSSSLNVGSHRVSGLNFAHIALKAVQTGQDFAELVNEDVHDVHLILRAHYQFLKRNIDHGLHPLYSNGWMSLSRQYSTVGFVGVYEALEILGKSLSNTNTLDYHSDGLNYMVGILQHINDMNSEEELRFNRPFNIEQIPAESMAVRLCKKDKISFGEQCTNYDLYSNQYFPLIANTRLLNRIKIQGVFDTQTAGGSILHINLMDRDALTPQVMSKLIHKCAAMGCTYLAINLDFNKCEAGHITIGKQGADHCSECGGKIVEKYTRVVGFITPVSSWQETRRDNEYDKRYRYGSIDHTASSVA